ncbi:hypothetical protein ACHAXA_010926 [Cyclostephanos tholiformis]|uniref:Uncharacterized protein n=1 Tax=Cyclostephanos tholiformis TaxID=382380 RepID=A0ABD3RAQ8_9STRA
MAALAAVAFASVLSSHRRFIPPAPRSLFASAATANGNSVAEAAAAASEDDGPMIVAAADDNNDNTIDEGRIEFRVFQTLPREPSSMTTDEVEDMRRTLRATRAMIFASPSSSSSSSRGGDERAHHGLDDLELHLDVYTPTERREYLARRGNRCHPRGDGGGGGRGGGDRGGGGGSDDDRRGGFVAAAIANAYGDVEDDEDANGGLQWYDVLSRYDSLMSAAAAASSYPARGNARRDKAATIPPPGASSELERAAIELFKYCVLYNSDGHAYWGWNEQLLLPFRDVVSADINYAVVAGHGTIGVAEYDDNNVGRVEVGNNGEAIGGDGNDDAAGRYLHESFLSISPYAPATSVLSSMIRLLLETPDDVLAASPLLLPRELHRLVVANKQGESDDGGNDKINAGGTAADSGDGEKGNGSTWTLLRNSCVPLADDGGAPDSFARRMSSRCPLSAGGYCCLAFVTDNKSTDAGKDNAGKWRAMPVMALRHPVGGWSSGGSGKGGERAEGLVYDGRMMPYALAQGEVAAKNAVQSSASSVPPLRLGGVTVADLPYVSTVRLVVSSIMGARPGNATKFPTHPADAPNFFDILFENDCLPYRKECHRCLRDVEKEKPGPGEPALTQRNACSACKLECPCYCDILCKVRPPPKPVTRTYSVRPPGYRKEPERLVPKIIHQTWFEPVTKDKYPNMSRLIESWKKSGWEYYFYDDETAIEFLGTHFPPEIKEAYESITPGAFKADLFRYCVLLIRGGVYADMDVLLQTNLDEAVANDVGFMTPVDEPGVETGHRSCLWNGLIASAPGHPFLARTIEIVVNNIRNRFTAVDYDDMLCPNPILSVSHTVDTLFTCGPCIFGAAINNILERHMQTEFEVGDVDIWRSQQNQTTAVRPDDPRLLIPGRTVILQQNKNDMGAHRFTWKDRHLIIAATDMPDYDDRPPTKEHYSKTHEKAGVYGMRKLYTDTKRANEEIRIVVEKL